MYSNETDLIIFFTLSLFLYNYKKIAELEWSERNFYNSFYPSLILSLYYVSLSLSLSLSLSISMSLSHSLSLSLTLYLAFSFSLYLPLSPPIYVLSFSNQVSFVGEQLAKRYFKNFPYTILMNTDVLLRT